MTRCYHEPWRDASEVTRWSTWAETLRRGDRFIGKRSIQTFTGNQQRLAARDQDLLRSIDVPPSLTKRENVAGLTRKRLGQHPSGAPVTALEAALIAGRDLQRDTAFLKGYAEKIQRCRPRVFE